MTTLNERLAGFAGWEKAELRCTHPYRGRCWVTPENATHRVLPDYEHSLDATMRDLWPLLEAQGYDFVICPRDVSIGSLDGEDFQRYGKTTAEAFARAVDAALGETR